ncbi:MAG TPA: chloride channel protein [Candidatus Limnocylindrales bacterium]|nr:chloride channel protein [Candidatus Limnocylindrales bacterium]
MLLDRRILLDGLRRRARSAEYLRKWVILGGAIGVIAGIGAAAFFWALDASSHLLLGMLAGFSPATPVGEGAAPITDAARPWALPLVVALGGLISGLIVFRFAPEAEGHGTDAAIAAFHHGARRVRSRIPVVKLVASAVTIGSGGSGGREGPTAQIGAGFGSYLARVLDLDARDARIAVAAGMAAGIGAIFRAPLGGAVLGAEIPYREDVEADALVPSFVASVVGFSVFGMLAGFTPIFGRVPGAGFEDPRQLLYYGLIGLAAGVVGRLYIRSFEWFTRGFRTLRLRRALRPALAGLAVGAIGIVLPGALGTGYGWVQAGFDRQSLMAIPLWIILVLPFAKILATSLSIGSGGSGGIFGPGMVIGGLLGAGIWRLLEPIAPGIPAEPAPFVIVAMMALFGSVAHAPLAVMLMVAEMTDNLAMLAPAMIAIGLATLIVGDRTMYRSQLRSRADSPAHRFRFALPLMASIPAGDAARSPKLVLRADALAGTAAARLTEAGVPGAPVVERDGTFRGVVSLEALAAADPARPVGTYTDGGPVIGADDGLDDALGTLADHHVRWAPVVADGRLAGIISARDAMTAYRRALAGNVRQVRGLAAGGVLLESDLPDGSALIGTSIAKVRWPREVVVVAIERSGTLIVPAGDVVFAAGDRVSVFSAPGSAEAARSLLGEAVAAELTVAGTDGEADPV